MTVLLRVRLVLAVAIGGLLVGGCSSDGGSSSAPTPSPSVSSPSATAPSPADCQVDGYVPRTRIELTKTRPVVVYAHRVTLAPSGAMGSQAMDLGRADLVRLRVRPDDPGATLTAADRQQILASGAGPVEDGSIVDTVYGRVHLKNTTLRNRSYLVYRGSHVYSGTWAKRVCGAPYNDGSTVDRVTGTYTTVSKIGPVKVTGCGVPASDSAVDRYAAHYACQEF